MPGILMSRMARSGGAASHELHGFVARAGLADHLVALLLEGPPQVEADDGLVFGDHHAGRQRWSPFGVFERVARPHSSRKRSATQIAGREPVEQLVLAQLEAADLGDRLLPRTLERIGVRPLFRANRCSSMTATSTRNAVIRAVLRRSCHFTGRPMRPSLRKRAQWAAWTTGSPPTACTTSGASPRLLRCRRHVAPHVARHAPTLANGNGRTRGVRSAVVRRSGTSHQLAGRCHLVLGDETDWGHHDFLPPELPSGYHQLIPLDAGPSTTLVVAPRTCRPAPRGVGRRRPGVRAVAGRRLGHRRPPRRRAARPPARRAAAPPSC